MAYVGMVVSKLQEAREGFDRTQKWIIRGQEVGRLSQYWEGDKLKECPSLSSETWTELLGAEYGHGEDKVLGRCATFACCCTASSLSIPLFACCCTACHPLHAAAGG